MCKKISGIIVIVLCLMLVLSSIIGLPPRTVVADDTVTSTNPAEFIVSNLVINPAVAESSQIISISVNVTNIGGVRGEYVLDLKVNGEEEGSMMVTLDPNINKTFTFTLTGQSPGHYIVDVNGLNGGYEISEAPPPITETTTPPPTTKIITQTPSDNQSSTTIMLGGPASEEEEPLSWWLIIIIVVGGLVIILVTWRLVHRAGQHKV